MAQSRNPKSSPTLDHISNLIRENDIESFNQLDPTVIANNNISYLKLCAHHGREAMAKHIMYYRNNTGLPQGIPINDLMILATASNKLDMVKLFILNGANARYMDNQALKIACCNGYYDIASYLLDAGAVTSETDSYALQVAASNGYSSIIRLLHKNNHKLFDNNNKAQIWAENNHKYHAVDTIKHLGIDDMSSRIPDDDFNAMYVVHVGSDEESVWIDRRLYDKNGRIISEERRSIEI